MWEVIGGAVAVTALLLTLGGIVWRAGRNQGTSSEKIRQSESLEGRVHALEIIEADSRLRDLRRDVERLKDYVFPAAERYLEQGGAVRFRQPEEGRE